MNKISDRLLVVMDDNSLNPRRLAILMGVSPVQVGRWIKGERDPSVESLQKLCATLDKLNLHWLITGEGDMYLQSESKISIEYRRLKKENFDRKRSLSELADHLETLETEDKVVVERLLRVLKKV